MNIILIARRNLIFLKSNISAILGILRKFRRNSSHA